MTKLNINDKNVNDLDNCDYLMITKLSIFTSNNINLVHPKKSLLCHFFGCTKNTIIIMILCLGINILYTL